MRFIRDLPIWTKLGLIMIVPTVATIVVGTISLLGQVEQATASDRARSLTVLTGDAGQLVHSLQEERAAAVKLLLAPDDAALPDARAEYSRTQEETEEALTRYTTTSKTIADLPTDLRTTLDGVADELGQVTQLRQQIAGRSEVSLAVAQWRYTVLVGDLLGIRDVAAQLTGDSALAARIRAADAVAEQKEYMSQERVIILQVLNLGVFTAAERDAYIASRRNADEAANDFRSYATPEQFDLYERLLSGAALRDVLELEYRLDALASGATPDVNREDWERATVGRGTLMNQIEIELNNQAQATAEALGAQVQRRVLIETGLLLLTLLVGVLFAWLVARSMARSLRDLRQGALAVAQYGLPQAVSRLRDPAVSTNLSPAGVALQIAEPLPVRSNDEFGQVTEAFNAVHLEAVRTAAEQAALRASVATMFVNLARRSQILVDRLIGHLDRLERGEQDPDRLSELFQLDHLATRMRRNDENLLVLAGADSTRIQREPAALMDVLRAAQSEVEQYTRVEFAIIDQDIEIAAHAVNDLVHLVAELFDNATSFSPPDTPIRVEARRIGERAVLRVEDRGIGMSREQYAELNDRLAAPPQVDVAVSRMMGLVVVARLGARHGVTVELQPSSQRGTIADVILPAGVLVPRALHGRAHAPSGFPAVRPSDEVAGSRSPFGPPLALEGGSRGGSYGSSTPAYGAPAPAYGAGAPAYGTPAPAYGGGGALATPTLGGGLGAALTSAGAIPPARNGGRVPSWYDLTGAGPTHGPAVTPAGNEPLPQRRPTGWGDETPALPQPGSAWNEPPTGPGTGGFSPPAGFGGGGFGSGSYGAGNPGAGGYAPAQPSLPPASLPPVTRPPAWPPASGADGTGALLGGANDMTVELPIFRELESAWFTTGSGPQTTPPPGAWPPEAPAVALTPEGAGRVGSEVSWRTVADDGWRAAQAAASPHDNGTTDHGLPRRVPMAQLVPGSVEESAAGGSDRRTPDSVRGLLSAYHRGVQRGRDAGTGGTDLGYPSGKEQEA